MSDHSAELRLLLAATPSEQENAWTAFAAAYSRLILHVARSVARDRDDAMDAYAFVIEQLRADDFARLRAFTADGRSKFSTWLVVVVRRLCLDHARSRYGRIREPHSDSARLEQSFRRRLGELRGDDVDLTSLAAALDAPDEQLSAAEVHQALAAAMDVLGPSDRLLLSLRFEDELSAQQIARVLRLPTPFHVYRRLEAVTRRLRELLLARGVEGAAS